MLKSNLRQNEPSPVVLYFISRASESGLFAAAYFCKKTNILTALVKNIRVENNGSESGFIEPLVFNMNEPGSEDAIVKELVALDGIAQLDHLPPSLSLPRPKFLC